jgi:uridine kinase
MSKVFIIGIAGGSGSGKTRLAKNVLKEINNKQVQAITVDSYYKDLSHLTFDERAKNNFDHPDAIDFDLLYHDLKNIMDNKAIFTPLYDYKTHTREKEKSNKIENVKVVILEGILALYNSDIRNLMSMKIFVDTPSDVRLLRRIKRDVNKRARSIESVTEQYNNTVKPMFLKFVKPTKDYADLIVPNGGKNKISIDAIVTNIKKHYI